MKVFDWSVNVVDSVPFKMCYIHVGAFLYVENYVQLKQYISMFLT